MNLCKRGVKVLTEIEIMMESKRKRIERFPKDRIDKILATEKKWADLALTVETGQTDELLRFSQIQKLVYGAACRWGKKYHCYRISTDDFLSVFYQAAWQTIDNYTWVTDFYLYETISKNIQNRGKSLLRDSLATDQRRSFHEALSLTEGFEKFYPDNRIDVELIATDNTFETQFLQDQALLAVDRRVLRIMYAGGSERAAAEQIEVSRRKISNSMMRIRDKLAPYLTS